MWAVLCEHSAQSLTRDPDIIGPWSTLAENVSPREACRVDPMSSLLGQPRRRARSVERKRSSQIPRVAGPHIKCSKACASVFGEAL